MNFHFILTSLKQANALKYWKDVNDQYVMNTDVVKNKHVRVINLISRTNKTRHVKWHGTCKCKCKIDASVFNNKQRCNNDKCRCECKELIDVIQNLFGILVIVNM